MDGMDRRGSHGQGLRAIRQSFFFFGIFALTAGCSVDRLVKLADLTSSETITVRKTPQNPLEGTLNLVSRKGPRPTPRVEQFLRRYNLDENKDRDPRQVLDELQKIIAEEPGSENVYAYAELAYIYGKTADAKGDKPLALDMYGASVAHSYFYLFDPEFDRFRNPYDPNFRRACDLYNNSLESALRIVKSNGSLMPGRRVTVETASKTFEVQVTAKGAWRDDDFERFEFASDYEVTGLTNRHHTYGLGVPLIAIRKKNSKEEPAERFYPPGLTFPVTAFLRVHPQRDQQDSHFCELELRDPLLATDVRVGDRLAPLETDISTPLAYYLNDPLLRSNFLGSYGLIDANAGQEFKGLYMLEPYNPHKIPVVMVHGLWSSPVTWMEMFNDLRSVPEIRENYQFWFFLYPTGQPFWISATQMRVELERTRQTIDPSRQAAPLDQMVLVGHSMGGLVSTMQTLESGEEFWRLISDRPFSELKTDLETSRQLEATLFFQPNRSVARVVTIATPHRGSEFANSTTRYLGRKIITLPKMLVQASHQVVQDNPDFFRDTRLLTMTTSIDSLAPDSPIFPAMHRAQRAPWVRYHNVIGEVSQDSFFGRFSGESDGVVAVASARIPYAISEVSVPADHSHVHNHPLAVLEVQRILREHLRELRATAVPAQNAAVGQTTESEWTEFPIRAAQAPSGSIYSQGIPSLAPQRF
jgi:pimeloyl-ACP methyl ester carboxylesterase